jgi:hypothetical protein
VNAAALILLAGGSVYLLGGLRDFWAQRKLPVAAADTVPSANATIEAAVRPEFIPPINRGVQASSPVPPPARRAARRPAPASDPPTDSARLGASTEETVHRNAESTDPVAGRVQEEDQLQHLTSDTARQPKAPPAPEREVPGYVPMASDALEEPRNDPKRPNLHPRRTPPPSRPRSCR